MKNQKERLLKSAPTDKYLIACILWIGILLGSTSEASSIYKDQPFSSIDAFGLSPYWEWRTLESENFRVLFPSHLKEIADLAAQYLEETHCFLAPILRWQPHYKTQILVIDNSDIANGLTAALLRVGIVLWVTPPENWDSNGYYDDWLRLLVVHEYTHFLNMDATSSFWSPLRFIFGDLGLPNSTWTPWMLEGLAVYMETRFTTAGRGRSPYYEMALRTAIEEQTFNTPSFVTINQISGKNPYFPGGDTRYQFGYQLINEVTKEIKRPDFSGVSYDKKDRIKTGEDILGILSERGSRRVPFFINDNLENITGKDWYTFWNQWTEKTQKRMQNDLHTIRNQPLSKVTLLTEKDHFKSSNLLSGAISPDGKWIAYTMESADQRSGLFLKNEKTKETKRLDDKIGGAGMSFTPDSRTLFYSEIRQKGQYATWSDLRAYDLEKNYSYELTSNLRAKDPHVSPDGKWVIFTLTETAITQLALAPLIKVSEEYKLGRILKIEFGSKYDHVANPKFSIDGSKIYCSFHPNGKSQEDILVYDRSTQKISVFFSDGNYNRFPIENALGQVYFISNLTGVNNLYHYLEPGKKPELVTNITTGIQFPFFNLSNKQTYIYASVFSSSGWKLGQVELLQKSISAESVRVSLPPAPPIGINSKTNLKKSEYSKYKDQPYSLYPSILPRIWTPLIGWDAQGMTAGAELVGFDAINEHRYVLGVDYESQLQQVNGFALYSNRSLGPSINLSGSWNTFILETDPNFSITQYAREFLYSASISYPLLFTYSNLTPSLAANLEQDFYYITAPNFSQPLLINKSPLQVNLDASLSFSNLETSNLAFTSEGGRSTVLGARLSFSGNDPVWKALLMDQEVIPIAKHTTLIPSVKAMWTSQKSVTFPWTETQLAGRTQGTQFGPVLFNPLLGDNLNQLTLRGYPYFSFFAPAGAVASIDFRFPIVQIFEGLGTNLLFLNQFYGFTFAELGSLFYSNSTTLLPSVGGGLRMTTELFFFPVTFSAEYHAGLQKSLHGTDDLFFQVILNALTF